MDSRSRLQDLLPRLVVAPSFVIILIFVYGFIAYTGYLSLTDSKMLPSYNLVGFENYVKLWKLPHWWRAFANLWIGAGRRELAIDLMRYAPDAPPNVMDYLFVKLIDWAKAEGFEALDLGMAPLAGLEHRRLAPALTKIGAAVYEEGETLYGFRGLRAFKQKFDPDWRPLFMAAPPGVFMPLALLDVAVLTSGGWLGLFGLRR